jgi:4-diphosphocytidyl-2-C-methyl-D-erythritol kinase
MIVFPNCKINLGLHILRKRKDGFHDLETVFYPLPLKDILEIIVQDPGEPAFTSYGLPIPGDPGDNLCLKAWRLLKADFPTLPPTQIHLYKHIPVGAGLGGGSADGAFTLLALDRQFQLRLTTDQMVAYAARLGSDCPFFIHNTPCLGSGRGEYLQPIGLDLSAWSVALVDPGIHISTAQAFAGCIPRENRPSLTDILRQPVERWKDHLTNDFEEPLFRLHPELATIKETLYAAGAVYASLTGSGSGIFAFFRKGGAPSGLPLPGNYRILQGIN